MENNKKFAFQVEATWNDAINKNSRLELATIWANSVIRVCNKNGELSEDNILMAERLCKIKTKDIIWKIRTLSGFWRDNASAKIFKLAESINRAQRLRS